MEFDNNDDADADDSNDADAATDADDSSDADADDDEKHRIETRNFVENKPCLLIVSFIVCLHSLTNKLGRTLQLHPC